MRATILGIIFFGHRTSLAKLLSEIKKLFDDESMIFLGLSQTGMSSLACRILLLVIVPHIKIKLEFHYITYCIKSYQTCIYDLKLEHFERFAVTSRRFIDLYWIIIA